MGGVTLADLQQPPSRFSRASEWKRSATRHPVTAMEWALPWQRPPPCEPLEIARIHIQAVRVAAVSHRPAPNPGDCPPAWGQLARVEWGRARQGGISFIWRLRRWPRREQARSCAHAGGAPATGEAQPAVTLVERPGELGREVRACGVQRRRESSAGSGEDAGAVGDGQLGGAAEGVAEGFERPWGVSGPAREARGRGAGEGQRPRPIGQRDRNGHRRALASAAGDGSAGEVERDRGIAVAAHGPGGAEEVSAGG